MATVEMTQQISGQKVLGIIGTGDYARALAKRLIFSGYNVIIGSRWPERRQLSMYDDCLCGVQMTSIEDCISRCDIIVAAIHMENFQKTLAPHADILAGKVVIDVSNRTNRYSAISNAEFLQSLIPCAIVVKAFNTVSAYRMEDQASVGNNRVFVCSDNQLARDRVLSLARDLGFAPSDMGALRAARNMEAFVLKVFPGWKVPLFFTFGLFNLWALYCVYIYYIETSTYRWDQVFLKVFNKPLCMTAITVLSVTYLAGSVAGIVQLWRGTKYSRFPRWLNSWMTSRRQLGLIALYMVLTHALMSAMMLSPTYYSSWFQKSSLIVPANLTGQITLQMQPTWMTWKGEAACLLGTAALFSLALVGVSSLPSVAASLNWAEWRLVQSRIGILALFLALCHVVVMGAPGWVEAGVPKTFRSITFLSGILPAITLLLRLLLNIPPFGTQLQRIRCGWERAGSRVPVSFLSSSTFSSCSSGSSRQSSCCKPSHPSILKGGTTYRSSSAALLMAPQYSPLVGDPDRQSECLTGCQENTGSSLPTRGCDCSVV